MKFAGENGRTCSAASWEKEGWKRLSGAGNSRKLLKKQEVSG